MDESATGSSVRVCHLDDLADGEAVVETVDGTEVALVLSDGEVYAMENVCPHQGGPVGGGKVEDGCIHCPWHGWAFELDSGEHVHGPSALNMLAVSVDDGEVYVEI